MIFHVFYYYKRCVFLEKLGRFFSLQSFVLINLDGGKGRRLAQTKKQNIEEKEDFFNEHSFGLC
jgi:hypothetical protein